VATNLNRLRKLYVGSTTAESTYGTAVATTSMLKVDAGVITNREIGLVSNNDLVGGTEEPTEQFVTNQSIALPIAQARVKPHTLATIAAYGVSNITTTTPTGASTARKHQITTSGGPNTTLKSFTAEGLMKTGLMNRFPGVFVDSFNFSVSRGANQFASLTSSCYGCGTFTTETEGARTEVDENPISGSTSGIAIATGVYDGATSDDNASVSAFDLASPTDITGQVTSFEYAYQNNVDRDFLYQVGSGKIYGIAEKVARTQTVTITKLYQDETYRTGLANQTEYSLQARFKGDQIGSEGHYYGCAFTVPKAVLTAVDVSDDGGRIVETLTFLPFWDATTGATPNPFGSVIIDVFNVQTAYAG
jgi:hypothetical protein